MTRPELSTRIKSILLFSQLLFDGSLIAMDGTNHDIIGDDYDRLLDVVERPDPDKIRQVRSVIQTYRLAFAQGVFTKDLKLEADIQEMLAFLAALETRQNRSVHHNSFIPKNLGSIFIRKGWGFPLFGFLRPDAPPRRKGIVLCYQSIEASGIAELQAAWLDYRTRLEYSGYGVAIHSSAPWLHVRVAPRGTDRATTLHPPFSGRQPDLFIFERYDIFVEKGQTRMKSSERLFDPLSYQYAYFFLADDKLGRNLETYTTDLITAMYGGSSISAEEVARNITQKLLQR